MTHAEGNKSDIKKQHQLRAKFFEALFSMMQEVPLKDDYSSWVSKPQQGKPSFSRAVF